MKTASAYAGMTGLTTVAHAEAMAEFVPMARAMGRRLMAGVLVSGHRTLQGEPGGSPRYPSIEVAGAIFARLPPEVFGVAHFNTRRHDPLDLQLTELMAACPQARGVQLNGIAPDPVALARFRRSYSQVEVVLQTSPALSLTGILDLAESGLAEHVLLDRSLGTGHPLDLDWAADVLLDHGRGLLGPGVVEPYARLRPEDGSEGWAFACEYAGRGWMLLLLEPGAMPHSPCGACDACAS